MTPEELDQIIDVAARLDEVSIFDFVTEEVPKLIAEIRRLHGQWHPYTEQLEKSIEECEMLLGEDGYHESSQEGGALVDVIDAAKRQLARETQQYSLADDRIQELETEVRGLQCELAHEQSESRHWHDSAVLAGELHERIQELESQVAVYRKDALTNWRKAKEQKMTPDELIGIEAQAENDGEIPIGDVYSLIAEVRKLWQETEELAQNRYGWQQTACDNAHEMEAADESELARKEELEKLLQALRKLYFFAKEGSALRRNTATNHKLIAICIISMCYGAGIDIPDDWKEYEEERLMLGQVLEKAMRLAS